MQNTKYIRAVDRLAQMNVDTSGFVVHKHTPASELSNLFMGIAVAILMVVGVLYYDSLQGFYICTSAGLLIMYVSFKLDRIQKMQVSTEFVNAIFSSAIGKDCRFCLAVRDDGEIIYVNRDFHSLFPEFLAQPILNLKKLGSMTGVNTRDQKKIDEALLQQAKRGITVDIRLSGNPVPESMSFLIEPLDIPKGYALIRGYSPPRAG